MDNASAVAYINKMGGTHFQGLAKLAIDLWEWCFQKDMMVSAQHLPGYLNVRADQESRMIQEFQRLETEPVSFSSPAQQVGPFRGRPFCIQANTPTAQICQLETRSNGNLRGCIFRVLERSSGVRLSPICPDRSLCTVGEVPESGSVSSSSTGMANSALVPIATATVCGSSTTISDVSSTSDQGRTVEPSEKSPISWVDAVDKSHETANVSEETKHQ